LIWITPTYPLYTTTSNFRNTTTYNTAISNRNTDEQKFPLVIF
jgi:hypothetical protein